MENTEEQTINNLSQKLFNTTLQETLDTENHEPETITLMKSVSRLILTLKGFQRF